MQDPREQQAPRHRQALHGIGQPGGGHAALQPSSGSGAHSRNSSFSGPNGAAVRQQQQQQNAAMNGILLGGGPPAAALQHASSARLGSVGAFGGGYGSVESNLASLGSLGGPAGLVGLMGGGGGHTAGYPAVSGVGAGGAGSEWGAAAGMDPRDPRDPRPHWQALQRAASGGVMASAVGMNIMARDFASQHPHLQQHQQQQQRAQQHMANGRPGVYSPMGHDASLGASIWPSSTR